VKRKGSTQGVTPGSPSGVGGLCPKKGKAFVVSFPPTIEVRSLKQQREFGCESKSHTDDEVFLFEAKFERMQVQ
jgi:hypothetical protein